MSNLSHPRARPETRAIDLARCPSCRARLGGNFECVACGRILTQVDGILEAIGHLSGTNRIAAALYDGPGWVRFKPLEQAFLFFQGPGRSAARRRVLRFLPDLPEARVLEVGLGDGDNLPLLPEPWSVFGVDLARNRLNRCRERFPRMTNRLALAEAEDLPFLDESFDAVFTVGGINYFRDPAAALREMKRVVKTGGTVVAADENPDLHRLALGRVLGFEALDAWCLRLSGLGAEFVEMVHTTPARVGLAAAEAWPKHVRHHIWNRLGYCLVDVREG